MKQLPRKHAMGPGLALALGLNPGPAPGGPPIVPLLNGIGVIVPTAQRRRLHRRRGVRTALSLPVRGRCCF